MTTKITEDLFLHALIGHCAVVYLQNGIKLVGVLYDHDIDAIFLRPDDSQDGSMMIMKQAISTILSTATARSEIRVPDRLGGILARPKLA